MAPGPVDWIYVVAAPAERAEHAATAPAIVPIATGAGGSTASLFSVRWLSCYSRSPLKGWRRGARDAGGVGGALV